MFRPLARELARFRLCARCHDLYETKPRRGCATPQRCGCAEPGADPPWPRVDFNRHLELCSCCRAEVVHSGSRWSIFFCDECRDRVRVFNYALGRYTIPIGRHSLHGGLGIGGVELAHADRRRVRALVHGFAEAAGGWLHSMNRLDRAARARTRELRRAAGIPADRDVPLPEWLEAVREGAAREPAKLGKAASFEALVRRFRRRAARPKRVGTS